MGKCYECTYRCTTGDGETVEFTTHNNAPCPATFTPPTAYGATGCRFAGSKEIECKTLGDKAAGAGVGGAGAVIVLFCLVSNPAGWVIAGVGIGGAVVGWLLS